MLAALGRALYRRRWVVLAGWGALALIGALAAGPLMHRVGDDGPLRPDAESRVAAQRIADLLPEGPLIVAVVGDRDPYDPPLVASVQGIAARLRATAGVVEVRDLYDPGGSRIGADNRSSLVTVELARGLSEPDLRRLADGVVDLLHRIDAPRVLVGGAPLADRTFVDQAGRDAARGESVALGVLLLLLLVVLGPVAGMVPLVAALGTVAGTLGALLALDRVTGVGQFTVNVVTLLGTGLAVDYAVLLVAAFREEQAAGAAPTADLIARTVRGAGRTVLVAGAAVAAGMAALTLFGQPLLAGMAYGGVVVALVATLAGVTLVPALLAVCRPRIGPPRRLPSAVPGTPLLRLARYAQRRPVPVLIGVAGALLLLALPLLFGARLADPGVRALPPEAEARRAYEVLQRDFEADRAPALTVVLAGDPGGAEVRDMINRINRLPRVLRTQPRPDVPVGTTVLDVTPAGGPGGTASGELVTQVRGLPSPVPMLVGGPAAELVDYQESVRARLPLALLALALSAAVPLSLLTGSVVIPVKGMLLTALTLLASLGLLVLVFQHGVAAGALGVRPGAVDVTTPVLLLVFVVGLSTDYEVFLLARITREWRRAGAGAGAAATDRAVLAGIGRTGPVVTLAAACITVVFLGFLTGRLSAVKEVGFGMAVAVAIDVTLVRGLLLPALMHLLAHRNWWIPAWPGRRRRVVDRVPDAPRVPAV
ncbi:MMPL family transporter [Plantactinospora sp. KBS50]|uniref:MMPL family transporter n=1 Tax=Plantactinospora sp. KBS50 TaxID=2024580 RepID=UPI000BAB21E5|nr:MMPL family transporter [Plantactinospora sp. KBS50]ASW52971.1 hypothetical protein CIK06_00365 [Plantactinospora sp. KBS50]